MIIWVAELCSLAVSSDNVYVATDDHRIKGVVESFGFNAVMTGDALTGTDRIAEAAKSIDADIIVNVQGDEPLVEPDDIHKVISAKLKHPDMIINGYSYLSADENPQSVNIPKVVTTEDDVLLYMSRLAVPGFKESSRAPKSYKKQVCIYAFDKVQLHKYRSYGRKSNIEESEDIEILRFLELGQQVKMIKTRPGSYAVDAPEDVSVVEAALKKKLADA